MPNENESAPTETEKKDTVASIPRRVLVLRRTGERPGTSDLSQENRNQSVVIGTRAASMNLGDSGR